MFIFKPSKIIKYIFVLIFVLIIVLSLLNINKYYRENSTFWSRTERIDRHHKAENSGLLNYLSTLVSPRELVQESLGLNLNVPITYLKQEIPLLSFYTPEDLKEAEHTLYENNSSENRDRKPVVKLTFDLRDEERFESTDRENSSKNDSSRSEGSAANNAGQENNNSQKRKQKKVPLIALYHTHTSETYVDDVRANKQGNVAPGKIGNVGRAGQRMADILAEKYNFEVIHTTAVHDKVYHRSYYNSRQTVKKILDKYPDIDILFDIHRDGVKNRAREAYTTRIDGEKMARIMIVVTNGKFDFAHLDLQDRHHVEWNQNLKFAHELAGKMEKMYPGLLKDIRVRETTYNQDLHPQSLLLEIGDYENTTPEVLRSAELMAEVIGEMY
ncbi:MAG: stage II sporulation protein P [Bacillota bacterium]